VQGNNATGMEKFKQGVRHDGLLLQNRQWYSNLIKLVCGRLRNVLAPSLLGFSRPHKSIELTNCRPTFGQNTCYAFNRRAMNHFHPPLACQ
jgi:hypothetical protein